MPLMFVHLKIGSHFERLPSSKLKENLIGIDLGFLLRRMWC